MSLKTLLLAAAASVALAGVAQAQTTTYHFSGDCAAADQCTGSVSGDLVLSGYTPGDPLSASDFVSFDYTSSFFPAGITIQREDQSLPFEIVYNDDLSGMLGSSTGPYDVSFSGTKTYAFSQGDTYAFHSSKDGSWSLTENGLTDDTGDNGMWTMTSGSVPAAPEPATWALMIAGVAGAGAALRMSRDRRRMIAA